LNYGGQQGVSGFDGFVSNQGGSSGGGFASSYESNSFSSQGDINATGYQGYNTSTGSNIDLAKTSFNAVDTNKDGSIDPNEFRQYIGSQNQYVYRFD
jgi:hypothetical protein